VGAELMAVGAEQGLVVVVVMGGGSHFYFAIILLYGYFFIRLFLFSVIVYKFVNE
jgi:hypothetical protein